MKKNQFRQRKKAFRAIQYKVHIKHKKISASTHVFFYIKSGRVRSCVRHEREKTQNICNV